MELVGLFVGAEGIATRGLCDELATGVLVKDVGSSNCQRGRVGKGRNHLRQALVRRNVLQQRQSNLCKPLGSLRLETLGLQLLLARQLRLLVRRARRMGNTAGRKVDVPRCRSPCRS
jgi:hypothetical protein